MRIDFTTNQNITVTCTGRTSDNHAYIYPSDFVSPPYLDDSTNTLLNITLLNQKKSTDSGWSLPDLYQDLYNSNNQQLDWGGKYISNSNFSGLSNFNNNYTFSLLDLYCHYSLLNYSGSVSWTPLTLRYIYVPYKLNITINQNGYQDKNAFSITESLTTNTSFRLQINKTSGYHLKGYYINNTYRENTEDKIEITIDPVNLLVNNTCNIELVMEPITFTAICKSIQTGNTKIITDISTINVTYGEDAFLPQKPNDTEEFIYFGWINGNSTDAAFRPSNDNLNIRAWISNNQIVWINDSTSTTYSLSYYNSSTKYPSNYNLKHFSTSHNSTYYFYYWIVPRCHKISYEWLDDLINERTCYQLPEAQYPRYNMDTLEVATIPLFNKYTVENAHTKNWYYYDNNNELQTNNLTTISSTNTEDITFYARKSLASESGSYITWSVNNPDWGEIDYYQTKPDDDYYDAASTVTVQAIPNNKRKFLKWNDNDTNPFKSELAGTTDRNYIATLASQTYIGENPVNDVYVGTTPVRAIYQGTTCVYERGD